MNSREIEIWALRVIKQAQSNQPSEDKLSELKREWPTDHYQAARRIGGHANAAGGEPILWLIGVDEKIGTVIGADHQEFTKWQAAIAGHFGGHAPRCEDLNIQMDNGLTVVALVFDTELAPYVVRNPDFGVLKTSVALEVPWREATRVRTATRADLLLILSEKRPLQALLGELEWNEAVVDRDGYELARLRTEEFHKVLNNGSLAAAGNLKSILTDAYLHIVGLHLRKRDVSSLVRGSDGGARRVRNQIPDRRRLFGKRSYAT